MCRFRICQPPCPHVCEQEVQADHSVRTQSCFRLPGTQLSVSFIASFPGQVLPPFLGKVKIERVRYICEWLSVHCVHAFQGDNSQSCGLSQTFSHCFDSTSGPLQGGAPPWLFCFTTRFRSHSPSHVGELHSVQSSNSQGTGVSSTHGLIGRHSRCVL